MYSFSQPVIFYMYYCSSENKEDTTTPERGLFHFWHSAGISEQLCPDRVLLSRPVVQAALGEHHGLLLTRGQLCVCCEVRLCSCLVFL